MLSKDLHGLYEAYNSIYENETDDIDNQLIEEVVEELIEECLELGYDLTEAADIVETATLSYFEEQYLDEATVTYGSDTESPEQRRERAKAKVGEKKKAARKAAVTGAVERVKEKAKGAKAAAGIAGSIAKDEARRAGRGALHSAGKAASAVGSAVKGAATAVKDAAKKKKEEVKKGVKSLIGRGLRKAAGAAGTVAQKARKVGAAAGKAAERLGEESINEADSIAAMRERAAKRRKQRYGASDTSRGGRDDFRPYTKADYERGEEKKSTKKESFDLFDVILEYLVSEGYADTNENALVIMANMSEEWKEEILTDLDEAHKPLPTEKMKRRRFYVNMKTGEAAGSSRNQKIDSVLQAHKKDPEGEAAKAKKKSKYKG